MDVHFFLKLDPNQNQRMNTGTDIIPVVRPVPTFLRILILIRFCIPDSCLLTSGSDLICNFLERFLLTYLKYCIFFKLVKIVNINRRYCFNKNLVD
jgi:hypothetical protein